MRLLVEIEYISCIYSKPITANSLLCVYFFLFFDLGNNVLLLSRLVSSSAQYIKLNEYKYAECHPRKRISIF